ncbi:MAG: peptide deformylase [Chlamydiae bacterium]|nr:peptide deformylase [Chlamydiota bacterium]
MILDLIYYGNPLLRERSFDIKEITDEVRQLSLDMIETMDAHNGIGLAAIQVGKKLRLIVIRPEIETTDGEFTLGEPLIFINPKITKPSIETDILSEGCLSIPKVHAEVQRPKSIWVEYLNFDGKVVIEEVQAFKAREIMHENDHLNGVLFIDRILAHKRKEIAPFLKEIKEKYN